MSKLRAKFDAQLAMEFYQKGMTDRQISDAMNVGYETVRKWRKRAGLVLHPAPRHAVGSRLDVDGRGRELYDQGATDKEIAAEFHISVSVVKQWRTKHGLTPNKGSKQVLTPSPAPKKPARLFMTDDEIRASWRRASSWREQVKILAELNACSVERMQEKLVELGCLVEVSS